MISKTSKALFASILTKSGLRSGKQIYSRPAFYFSKESQDFSNLTGDSLVFPREQDGLDYKLNWELAKANIVPGQKIARNTSKTGTVGGHKTKVVEVSKETTAQFASEHTLLTKQISTGGIFIEDGELGNLHVRVIASSADGAAHARACLTNNSNADRAEDGATETIKGRVTVLIGTSEGLKDTIVDKARRLVLTPSAHKDSLQEAILIISGQKENKKE